AIAYGNSSNSNDGHTLATASLGFSITSNLYRCYSNIKHSITPYANYCYTLKPTLLPDDHFIFDIDDGWYSLNSLRFGIKQQLISPGKNIQQPLMSLDIYADAFFNTPTIETIIPRGYICALFNPIERLR